MLFIKVNRYRLEKAKKSPHLVPEKRSITRAGKTFMMTVWVNPNGKNKNKPAQKTLSDFDTTGAIQKEKTAAQQQKEFEKRMNKKYDGVWNLTEDEVRTRRRLDGAVYDERMSNKFVDKKTKKEVAIEGASIFDGENYVQVSHNYEEDENGETGNEYAKLEHIYVAKNERGKGKATAMIKEAIKNIRAVDSKIPIYLAALPERDEPMDQQQLFDFYEKIGFSYVPGQEGSSAIIMKY